MSGASSQHMTPRVIAVALVIWFFSLTAVAAPHRQLISIDNLDQQVKHTLELLTTGDVAQARLMARTLAWRFPDFPLGHLLMAELESVAAFNNTLLVGADQMQQLHIDLLLEARARLTAVKSKGVSTVPLEIIQAGDDVSQVILVDLENATLYHFDTRTEQPNLLRQHYAGSGKAGFGKFSEGDNKTPLGVYEIVDHRSDESLPELYGAGALTLNYPNALDKYLGRTGYGIWLHGIPRSQLSRTPRSSEGCVTMSNEHLLRLANQLELANTRVVLTDRVRWLDEAAQAKSRSFYHRLFQQYQNAWIKGDTVTLSNLYRHSDVQKPLSGSDGFVALTRDRSLQAVEPHHLLESLATVDPRKISIFHNPVLRGASSAASDTKHQIVMNARFGEHDEHNLTIYWARSAENGWQIIAEQLAGISL